MQKIGEAVIKLLDIQKGLGEGAISMGKSGSHAELMEIVMGLISLANGDIAGIEPLAVMLGGFPKEIEKLIQFVKILKQNKDGLNFKGAAKLTANEAIAQGEKMAAAAATNLGLDSK